MTSKEVFEKFTPAPAVSYCNYLYNKLGFVFKVRKARATKLGDYRHDRQLNTYTLSINNDLNPYAFLITYLHEVAHLMANRKYGSHLQPHGKEWKDCFREVARPILNNTVFTPQMLAVLEKHLKNPKATHCSDPALYEALRSYDQDSDKILLKEVSSYALFEFKKRTFRKLCKKRTRYVCEEIPDKKNYLISEWAEVKPGKPTGQTSIKDLVLYKDPN